MKNQIKKLYKSKSDRMITGVCGGIAEYLGADSFMVRLIFILLAFANGIGILIYAILFFIIPCEGKNKVELNEKKVNEFSEEIKTRFRDLREDKNAENNAKNVFGIVIIIIGILIILKSYFNIDLVALFFPVLVIVLGFYVLVKS